MSETNSWGEIDIDKTFAETDYGFGQMLRRTSFLHCVPVFSEFVGVVLRAQIVFHPACDILEALVPGEKFRVLFEAHTEMLEDQKVKTSLKLDISD